MTTGFSALAGAPVKVAICRYGAGNVRSVALAFTRLGCSVDAGPSADVMGADLVVLPGVGSARTAMEGLVAREIDLVLKERVAAGRPVLGVCLGLQLALDWTDEDGGVAGLGLVPGRAVRLTEGRVPRMGWAPFDDRSGDVSARQASEPTADSGEPSDARQSEGREPTANSGESRLRRGTYSYYYAHSYAADSPATTQWSEGVAVELRRGAFVGCQFHPEKSGVAGAHYLGALLAGWGLTAPPDDARRVAGRRIDVVAGPDRTDEALCHSPG